MDVLETVASFVSPLLRQRLADPRDIVLPECRRVDVAAALIDVEGFSALAERMSRNGTAGVEDLAQSINACFGSLVATIRRHGGEAHRFPGDSVIAIWCAEGIGRATAARRAVQCALELAGRPFGGLAGFKLKAGVGAGDAVVAHVGGVNGRGELLLAGPALASMGRAERLARAGEVLVAPDVWEMIGAAGTMAGIREGFVVAATVETDASLDGGLVSPTWSIDTPRLSIARRYVPHVLLDQLDAGQAAWIGEFRDLVVLFVALDVPDVEASDAVRVHEAFCCIQRAVYSHGGSVMRLAHDDKGIAVLAAMGLPPRTHENDAERAVRAALAIELALGEMDVACHIGVAAGRAYCGPLGGPDRREYSLVGTVPNRAARLAGARRGILCDPATVALVRDRLEFEGPLEIPDGRGGAARIAHRPTGARAAPRPAAAPASPMLGRAREARQIAQWLGTVWSQSGRVLLVRGEPGVGKSRILADVTDQARAAEIDVLLAACDPMDSLTPYRPWRDVVASLLGLARTEDVPADAIVARVRERTGDAMLAPLLGPVFGVAVPESAETSGMVGAVRRDNTVLLVLHLIEAYRRDAGGRPLLLDFEDVQWMDSASWAVIDAVVRGRIDVPVSFALTSRPEPPAAGDAAATVLAGDWTTTIELQPLSADAVRELVCRQLGAARITPDLAARVYAATQGNPLFCEEYVEALREHGALGVFDGVAMPRRTAGAHDPPVPTSVRAVITTRIDRLAAPVRLTLKLASVAGQRFDASLLARAHPHAAGPAEVASQLAELAHSGFLRAEPGATRYAFKHALIREVAYDLMLYAQRRALHRVLAEQLERHGPGGAEATILHHWRAAGEVEHALPHVDAACRAAMQQGSYHEAIELFDYGLAACAASASAVAASLPPLTPALWRAQLGEAQVALGIHEAARANLVAALEALGEPAWQGVPAMAVRLAIELVRQASHRLAGPLHARDAADAARRIAAASAYEQLGYIHYSAGETFRGVCAAISMLNLAEGAPLTPVLARSYAAMSLTASVAATAAIANAYESRALAAATGLGDLATDAHVHWVAAQRAGGEGRWTHAATMVDRALALAERVGDTRLRVMALETRAASLWLCGDLDTARSVNALALELAYERGVPLWEGWALGGLAEVAFAQGDFERTADCCSRALAIYATESDRLEELRVRGLLAAARWRLGDGAAARSLARETLARAGETDLTAFVVYAGIAEAAETLLEFAEDAVAGSRERRSDTRMACRALGQLARTFPIGRPRHALARARALALAGHDRRARAGFRRAILLAEAAGMPRERAHAATIAARSGMAAA